MIRDGAGDRFGQIELSTFPTFVFAADRDEGARRYATEQGWGGLPAAEVLRMPAVFVGSVAEIAAAMVERRERFGFSYFVVSDADLAAAGPLVARLAGA